MPFFSDEQIKLIVDGLKNHRTDEEIAIFSQALYSFDAGIAQNNPAQTLCQQVQYISDEDLYGSGGLIKFLQQLNGSHLTAQLIINAITTNFLPRYSHTITRFPGLFPYRFKALNKVIHSHFVSCYSQERDGNVPEDELPKLIFEVLNEFLVNNRFSIPEIKDAKTFAKPITQAAFKILEDVLTENGVSFDHFEKYRELDNKLAEGVKEAIYLEVKTRLYQHLMVHIVPILKDSHRELAKRMGIDISKSALIVGRKQWLTDEVIRQILNRFIKNNFPQGLPPGYAIVDPCAIFSPSQLENKLREAFQRANPTGALLVNTLYLAGDIGGHWVFFKIKKEVGVDKDNQPLLSFTVTQINSTAVNKEATRAIGKVLGKIFASAQGSIKLQHNTTGEQSGVDNYSCGDRTMSKLIDQLLADLVTAFQNGNYQTIRNPWAQAKPSKPKSIRSVTLKEVEAVRPASSGDSDRVEEDELRQPRSRESGKSRVRERGRERSLTPLPPPPPSSRPLHGSRQERLTYSPRSSYFDRNRMLLLFLTVLFILGVVSGGFGIAALTGSVIAAAIFTSTGAAAGGIVAGIIGSVGLLCLLKGLINAFRDMARWLNRLFSPPPPPPSGENPANAVELNPMPGPPGANNVGNSPPGSLPGTPQPVPPATTAVSPETDANANAYNQVLSQPSRRKRVKEKGPELNAQPSVPASSAPTPSSNPSTDTAPTPVVFPPSIPTSSLPGPTGSSVAPSPSPPTSTS